MFPGYLLMVTRDMDACATRLGELAAPGFLHLLTTPDGLPASLPVREARLIAELAGDSRCVAASEGAIVDGRLVVYRGPLAGREDLITKIDRHKRMAYLDMSLLGRPCVRMALEVVSKT